MKNFRLDSRLGVMASMGTSKNRASALSTIQDGAWTLPFRVYKSIEDLSWYLEYLTTVLGTK